MLARQQRGTCARNRRIGLAAGLVGAALVAMAAPSPAAAGVLDDPLYDGVNRFEVTLLHTSAVHPPLIRYSTVPAGIACRLSQLSYVAIADEPGERHNGRAALTVRCTDIPEGARVRLDYGRPLVRSVRIHNGDGRLNVRLDKPPGSVNPQVLLRTTPHGRGSCTPRSLHERETPTTLTISGRFRCRGLPRNARAVLAIGGVVAGSPTLVDPAGGPAPSNARASGACGGGTVQQRTGNILKNTQRICAPPGYMHNEPINGKTCPTGWVYRDNGWPGFVPTLAPDNGWWAWGEFLGAWSFTNWSLDVSRVLTLTWDCHLGAPANTAAPTQTGDAKVGGTLTCNAGTWLVDVLDYDFQWIRNAPGGGAVAIPGALGQAYVPTRDDVGRTVYCRVTAYNAAGTSSAAAARATDPIVGDPPRALTSPNITVPDLQSVSQGTMATCNPGTWDQARVNDPFTYQWARNDVLLPGETRQQFRIAGEVGDLLSCYVTGHNLLGSQTVVSLAVPIVLANRIL